MVGTIGSTDGTGAAALFYGPVGITTDGTNLYVSDNENGTIRQIVIATGKVTTLAGTAGLYGTVDGTGAAARFSQPYGITTDGTNLYVADFYNETIRQIVIATGKVTTLAGTAGVYGSVDGTGAAARFRYPVGITTDGTNLYVTELINNTIRQIVIATGKVTTLAGTADFSGGSVDGTGAAAQFNQPYGITTDGSNLYVVDTGDATFRQIVIASGKVTTLPITAGFDLPTGITTDGTNIYVTDARNNAICQIH